MSGRFEVLGGGEPDEIDLELAALGESQAIERTRRVSALDPARAELMAWRLWWEAHRTELLAPQRCGARRRGIAGLLLAAAVLIGLLVASWPEDGGVRAMGGLPVDLAVTRGSEGLSPPYLLRPGDLVQVRLVAPRDGVLEVWTVQDDGGVSLLEPGRPVQADELFRLDGAARLDAYPGREWLVVRWLPAARDAAAVRSEAAGLLPDPAGHRTRDRWVFEITRASPR